MLPSNDCDIPASWKIVCGDVEHVLAFDGLGDVETRPLERRTGVRIRHPESSGLYFGRRPSDARSKRPWEHELDMFVAALDQS